MASPPLAQTLFILLSTLLESRSISKERCHLNLDPHFWMGCDCVTCGAALVYFGTNKIFSHAVFKVQSMSCSAFPRSTRCGCKWPFSIHLPLHKACEFQNPFARVRSVEDMLLLLLLLNSLGVCAFIPGGDLLTRPVFRSLQMHPSQALFHLMPQYSPLPQGCPRNRVDRIGPWLSTIHKP